ncbi:unnamed protein product [Parajaminaea phylloscopi]
MTEKQWEQVPLLGSKWMSSQRKKSSRTHAVLIASLLTVAFLVALPSTILSHGGLQARVDDAVIDWIYASKIDASADHKGVCPQASAWQRPEDAPVVPFPQESELAQRLSKAVQIDTTVFDNEKPPEEDPELWKRLFEPFREYLQGTFPRVHQNDGPISRELVHEHGLLYTWKGTDDSLKPVLLMAHQDVVPVDPASLDAWVAPPFSGALINATVVGRGTTDIKNLVVSILSALEALLEAGFQPERTVLVAFGYDEEVGGHNGGRHLGQRIEEIYGKDSVALVVDEGNPVMSPYDRAGFGIPVAVPGIEEKGSVHVRIRIEAPGGHSSMPPRRTTVGLLSEIISRIENGDNLREAVIPDLDSAYLKTLQCLRDSVPGFPHGLRQALRHLEWASKSSTSELVAASRTSLHSSAARAMAFMGLQLDHRRRARIDRAKRALLAALPEDKKLQWSTTQTPTLFHGGVKVNAIPASSQVDIDHRVALHHTIEYIQEWYTKRLTSFAKQHNLALSAWGQEAAHNPTTPAGKMTLELGSPPLHPAPRTPTSGADANAWRLFQSLIRSTWQQPPSQEDRAAPSSSQEILVAPSQMNGNTDTRWMWALSRNIFRFMPASLLPDPFPEHEAFRGVHNVNEHYRTDGLVHAVRFYADLIVAADRDRDI